MHGIQGGFLADDPGVGKTAQIVGLIVVRRLLWLAYDDIQKARSSNVPATQARHLPKGTDACPQPPNAKCPSQKDWGIQCPCVESGEAAKIMKAGLSRGPTLIIPPPSAINVWTAEFIKFIDKRALLSLEVYVYHDSAEKTMPALQHRQVICNDNMLAPDNSEKFIFITSAKCLHTRLLEKFRQEITVPYPKKPGRKVVGRRDGLVWGLMVRDELQLDHRPSTQVSMYFKSQASKNSPQIWALSGTPFEASPEDLNGHIGAIERQPWHQPNHLLYKSSTVGMTAIATIYKRIVSGGDVSPREARRVVEDLNYGLKPLMIRRRDNAKFFDQPILDLPKYQVRLKKCPTNDAWITSIAEVEKTLKAQVNEDYQKRIQAWMERGQNGPRPKQVDSQFMSKAFFLRLCGGFPELANMYKDDDGLSFRSIDLRSNGWLNNPQKSPFWENRARLRQSSSKWSMVIDIMKRISKDEDPNRPEKFVLLSFTPNSAFILKCVS
jgi:hypothetical protein